MAEVVEAPNPWYQFPPNQSLFLAGGITGCPTWQDDLIAKLTNTNLVILNPRRKSFDLRDSSAARQQIEWEFEYLRAADAISFWFCAETLCPIALYELGAWSMTDKKLFVGAHPHYPRREDVIVQTNLARPAINVVHSLDALETQIKWRMALV